MDIYLDTCNLKEIKSAADSGLLSGITTNPSILEKENLLDLETAVKKFHELVPGPINLEVNPNLEKRDEIVEEAKRLRRYGSYERNENKIVVKVHICEEGLGAVKLLKQQWIPTNVTLNFNLAQAYFAAKAGATYISPFVGRLDDIGEEGMNLVRDIKQTYKNYGYKTKIIVGSVRNLLHVLEAMKIGADIVTMPYNVFEKFKQQIRHPLTDKGLAIFRKDYNDLIGCEQA